MPVRPENRALYPKNWNEIRAQVRDRSGDRCEWPGCNLPNGITGIRFADGSFDYLRFTEEVSDHPGARWIKIVLTVAHLDHNPANCDLSNLRHWCQYHHLRYDAPHHAQTRRATQERSAGQLRLEMAR